MIVDDGTLIDLSQPHLAIYDLDPVAGWNHHPLGINSIVDEGLPKEATGVIHLRADRIDECHSGM